MITREIGLSGSCEALHRTASRKLKGEFFMKRLTSLILAALCVAGMASVASAAGVQANAAAVERARVEAAAYSVIDDATPAERQAEIRAARNQLIFGDQAWTVEGAVSKFNVDTGKVESLPDFYDLFPDDWEIPVLDTRTTAMPAGSALSESTARSDNSVYYRTTRTIPSETETGWSTEPFYHFQVDETGRDVGVTVTSFAADRNALYNAGFVDAGDQSLGWVPGLLVKQEGASISGLGLNRQYGVVVSMVKTGGSGQILVDYADLISADFTPVA